MITLLLSKLRDNRNFKIKWLVILWNRNSKLILLNVTMNLPLMYPTNLMWWTVYVINGKTTIENLINKLKQLVKLQIQVFVIIVVPNISEVYFRANFSHVKINVLKLLKNNMFPLLKTKNHLTILIWLR